MTPKEVAQALDNRILAFLQNIASNLAAKKIFTHEAVHVWDHENGIYEWWLLVYPWTRVTKPPENAVIAEIRFERHGKFLNIVAELESVEGAVLYRWAEGEDISLEKADISEYEVEFERYEDPDSIVQIAAKIETFIKRARSGEPKGPREWSPRLKGSEPKKKPDEPVRINIVEEKEWKENWTWESTDFDERIQRLSDAYYETLFGDKDECESLIEDIMGTFYDSDADEGPREWAPRPRKIGPEGVKKVCKAWHNREMEAVDSVIRDTIQYMYEDASIPDGGDIQHAIQEAKDKLIDEVELDYELWDPLLDKGWHEQDIMIQLMNEVNYNRAPRAYDRYIAFDFINAGVVKDLLAAWPKKDRGWVRDALKSNEFRTLRNNFMGEFFEKLEKDMKDSDPDFRTNWDIHWGGMIVDDARMEAVRKEIFEFLKTAPELPEEDE